MSTAGRTGDRYFPWNKRSPEWFRYSCCDFIWYHVPDGAEENSNDMTSTLFPTVHWLLGGWQFSTHLRRAASLLLQSYPDQAILKSRCIAVYHQEDPTLLPSTALVHKAILELEKLEKKDEGSRLLGLVRGGPGEPSNCLQAAAPGNPEDETRGVEGRGVNLGSTLTHFPRRTRGNGFPQVPRALPCVGLLFGPGDALCGGRACSSGGSRGITWCGGVWMRWSGGFTCMPGRVGFAF